MDVANKYAINYANQQDRIQLYVDVFVTCAIYVVHHRDDKIIAHVLLC